MKPEKTTYTTKQIADANGVHCNTVRFYERIGLITKPGRLPNGYRVYTRLHMEQCGLIRLCMRAEALQNGLRKKAIEIVNLCAALDFPRAIVSADEYAQMLNREIDNARAAIASVEGQLAKTPSRPQGYMKRADAAASLGVTSETLRTWERSGLIRVARSHNGYRVYSSEDMDRLNVVRTLRCAGYSLSAILRLLNRLDGHAVDSLETILNTPESGEEIVSACDALIVSLQKATEDVFQIRRMLVAMQEKYQTIQ